MLKNGDAVQFDPKCPFDCTKWDECVCENTALLYGMTEGGFIGFTADEITAIEVDAASDG